MGIIEFIKKSIIVITVKIIRAIILTVFFALVATSACPGGDGKGNGSDKGSRPGPGSGQNGGKDSFSDFLRESEKEAKKKSRKKKNRKRFNREKESKDELKSFVETSAAAADRNLAKSDYDSYATRLARTLDMLSSEQQARIFRD